MPQLSVEHRLNGNASGVGMLMNAAGEQSEQGRSRASGSSNAELGGVCASNVVLGTSASNDRIANSVHFGAAGLAGESAPNRLSERCGQPNARLTLGTLWTVHVSQAEATVAASSEKHHKAKAKRRGDDENNEVAGLHRGFLSVPNGNAVCCGA